MSKKYSIIETTYSIIEIVDEDNNVLLYSEPNEEDKRVLMGDLNLSRAMTVSRKNNVKKVKTEPPPIPDLAW